MVSEEQIKLNDMQKKLGCIYIYLLETPQCL